jgi:toxin ParE1/3/4
MAKISWTSEAERWLKDIYDYIATDNPHAAADVIAGIYEKAQMLAKFPEIGYRYDKHENDEVASCFTDITVSPILSGPMENIDILGVFHGVLDIQRYLL